MIDYARYTFERLITSKSFVDIFHDTVILILGLALIFALRKPVSNLLARLKSHESNLLGKIFLGPESYSPLPSEGLKSGQQTLLEKIDRSQSAHFFWLGSDLIDFILLLSSSDVRLKSKSESFLIQIRHHFFSAGLENDEIEKDLEDLIRKCLETQGGDWRNENNRIAVRRAILSIRARIASLVELNAGPNFVPWAEENQPKSDL